MNYTSLADTISPDLVAAVEELLNPEVDPDFRIQNLEIVLREVGDKVYYNIYDMAAYDMLIEYTEGIGINDAYYGMAKVLSDSVSVGNRSGAMASLEEWLANQIIKGESDAFYTAKGLGQHPILVRTEPGGYSKKTKHWEEPCEWCQALAGVHIDPMPGADIWRRHDNCHGSVSVSGYRSRNGELEANGHGWRKES